jgi:malate permease and related proteins
MMNYTDVFFKIIPVILLFTLGIVLRKINFFKENTISELKKIVVNIALPCLLFIAFSNVDINWGFILVIITVFLICLSMLGIGIITGKILKIKSPYFFLLFGGFETGMIGYAIFISMYGIGSIDKLAVIDLGQVIFVFFILVTILIKMKKESKDANVFRLFISSPVIIAIITGIIFSVIKKNTGLENNQFYGSILQFIAVLGNLTAPLICISIGYELTVNLSLIRLPLLTIFARTILLLTAAVLMNKILIAGILHLEKIYEYAVLTMFLLPPPFVISVYMNQDDAGNKQFVLNTLSLSTIISVIVFIITVIIYK